MGSSGLLEAGTFGPLQVTTRTTECSGGTGFASFNVDQLYKIQDAHCEDPAHPGRPLKQVLIKSRSGLSRFEVLYVTEDDLGNINQQIDLYMGARVQGPYPPTTTVILPPPVAPARTSPQVSPHQAPDSASGGIGGPR